MRSRLPPLLASCLLLAAACTTPTEEELAAFTANPPVVPDFDASLLDLFTGTDEGEYTLGAGDLIAVDVWGRIDLSGPHVIGPDGRITLPTAGPLVVTGLTRGGAADAIARTLGEFYTNVSVTVRVDEYRSASVTVLGGVNQPGTYPFTTPPTLLRAIADAGGMANLPSGLRADRVAILRGQDRMVWIDVDELLGGGNTRLNVTLSRDDVVFVQDSSDALVYVLGEVIDPGVYRLKPGMDVMNALSLAGGWTVDAQPSDLLLLRPSEQRQIEIDMDEYLDGRYELDLSLRPGDVIFLPRNGLAIFGYVLHQISPFSSVVVSYDNSGNN